ncbi:MAG: glycoside hydrolase, partial [Sphingobacteriales bacterium]
SPKEMGLPGQEYFAGSHFNPNVTWWDQSTGFISYLTRCQYMLQQGRSVADVLYYYGDHVPNLGRYKQDDPAGALPGYDYDLINEDKLLNLTVSGNRIRLPHGVSYRLLVIPDHRTLSFAAIKKIAMLVADGATVLGPKPTTTASLVGFPNAEEKLVTMADQLWTKSSNPIGSNKFGKGRVIWGKTAAQVLQEDKIPADFQVIKTDTGLVFDYIHREIAGQVDFYFVSSQNRKKASLTCSFRNTGRQPELWDPVTGICRPLRFFKEQDGSTSVDLQFDPFGSAFIIFRLPSTQTAVSGSTPPKNYPEFHDLVTLDGKWQVRFDTAWGGPASARFDTLQDWISRSEPGIKYYSGKAVYQQSFDVPDLEGNNASNDHQHFIELGDVKDVGIASVTLNGKDLGITWCPPFRLPLGEALRASGNKLEILVVNSWRNRLIGDRDNSAGKKFTNTNITVRPDWQLVPSGLTGPVKIVTARW